MSRRRALLVPKRKPAAEVVAEPLDQGVKVDPHNPARAGAAEADCDRGSAADRPSFGPGSRGNPLPAGGSQSL